MSNKKGKYKKTKHMNTYHDSTMNGHHTSIRMHTCMTNHNHTGTKRRIVISTIMIRRRLLLSRTCRGPKTFRARASIGTQAASVLACRFLGQGFPGRVLLRPGRVSTSPVRCESRPGRRVRKKLRDIDR